MTGGVRVEPRSLRALRARARTGRALAGIAVGMLALAGLRAVVEPTSAAPKQAAASRSVSPQVRTFAEGFARAYLSWDAHRPEGREDLLQSYLAGDLDPDGGLSPSGGESARVEWTAVAAERTSGATTNVTVAADRDGELFYLAVPVRRDRHGFLSVAAYPALVGPPAADPTTPVPLEPDVEDSALRSVCERAVRNYLAVERRNLAADLAPGAVVSLPGRRLELRAVDSVTWVDTGRWVAVQVRAEGEDGAGWTLRYELRVVRRERWYVRAIQMDPRTPEGGTS